MRGRVPIVVVPSSTWQAQHVCELQIVHSEMQTLRKRIPAQSYNDYKNNRSFTQASNPSCLVALPHRTYGVGRVQLRVANVALADVAVVLVVVIPLSFSEWCGAVTNALTPLAWVFCVFCFFLAATRYGPVCGGGLHPEALP